MATDVTKDVQMGSIASPRPQNHVDSGQYRFDDDNSGRDSSPMRKASTKCAYCRKDRKKASWKACNAFCANW
jgi:hypothetical protein